jgi:hypothetical protein
MNHSKNLAVGLISVLLLLILTAALFIDRYNSPMAYRTPIPAATIAAFHPGSRIHSPSQAVIAAQFYLGTTRLRADGDILPYQAGLVRYREAITRTNRPAEIVDPYAIRHGDVWLVLLEGAWTIEPPVPDPAPSSPQAGCAYAILDASNGEGMGAGGIRPCGEYQVRPAGQIIQELFRLKGISARPGTRAYGDLMRGIMLGGYPELTGLFHNYAEMERVYDYAGQHLWDGIWRFWEQPNEPEIPEALPPNGMPIPTESRPAQSIWNTPKALPPTETPRPTRIPPPVPTRHNPGITVPLPIPAGGNIQTGEWLSATRLQVTIEAYQSSGFYWIDLGTGEPRITTPRQVPATQQDYSASSLYSVQCGNPLQMMDAASQTVICQADLILNPNAMTSCTTFVGWAGDEMAAFAARDEGVWSTYLWLPDGSPPTRVGPALNGARPPTWSPDGEQFAFLTATDTQPLRLQIMIADRSGRLLQTLPTNQVLQPTEFHWIGRRVLALRDSNNLWQYYQADTGEVLFTWQEALTMGSALDHDYPQASPDGHWLLIERDDYDTSSRGLHITYSLYDLQNHQEILLYEHPWHKLAFSGWSPHGDALYLLHYPAGPDAAADPDLPYGLLAYHPFEGQLELLVENARAVYWDVDSPRALVYVLNPDSNGQLTLNAGVWDPTQNRVIGAFPITNPPSQYDFLIAPSALHTIAPAAWSPDGRKAAFLSWQGDLLLMGLDGQTQLLASQVGLGRANFSRLLAWSPDGGYLFVSDRGTVWIVSDHP